VNFAITKDKIKIICPIHGEFEQTLGTHLNGNGCKKCVLDKLKLGKDEFIRRAKSKFGDRYDYSKVEYVNNVTKVIITCKKHGDFETTPANHLNGLNCKYCNYDSYRMSLEEFIEKANKIHDYRYNYSETIYGNNGKEKVKIICKDHGIFEQSPNEHLSGRGCSKCILKSQTKLFEKLKKLFPNEEIL
jgi:hypothetical protein